jgi:hypothetical protein
MALRGMPILLLLSLAGCSTEPASAPADRWVTASSLEPPKVAYTPKPIIAVRQTGSDLWVWHPERATPKTIRLEPLLREIAAAKSLNPEPLMLFSFKQGASPARLSEVRSSIADAAGCSPSSPCIEGTPDQLP